MFGPTQGKASVVLSTFGGLITEAPAPSLSEGSSPLTYDTDFLTGSVMTRPGLLSVYTGVSGEQMETPSSGTNVGSGTAWSNPSGITNGGTASVSLAFPASSQFLKASLYPFSIPSQAKVLGFEVAVTGQASQTVTNPVINNNNSTAVSTWSGGSTATVVAPGLVSQPNINVGDIAFLLVLTNSNAAPAVVGTVSGLTDNFGNTWAELGTVQSPIPSAFLQSGYNMQVFWAEMTHVASYASPMTVTMTVSNPSDTANIFSNFFNVQNLSPTPTTVNQTTVAAANPNSGNLVIPVPSMYLSFCFGWALGSLTIPSGWTDTLLHPLGGSIEWDAAYDVVSPGTHIDQWTGTMPAASTDYATLGVAFPLIGGGGGATDAAITLTPTLAGASSVTLPLTTSSSTVTVGSLTDLWGLASITPAQINNSNFGAEIGVTTTDEDAFVEITDVTITVAFLSKEYVWVKTYQQQSGQIYTLALDSLGGLWREDVTNNPGVLVLQSQTVMSGDGARSTTAFNREYVAFSNHDIPRQYNGVDTAWDRVSQEGPAAPVSVNVQATANPNQAHITDYTVVSNVVTFSAVNTFTTGEFVQISLPGSPFDGQVLVVQTASGTQFTANYTTPDVGTTPADGTATPLTSFAITSITQPAAGNIVADDWGAGPGSRDSGNIYTIYYGTSPDTTLINAFNSGLAVYVYLTFSGGVPFVDGTYQVTSIGIDGLNNAYYYFTCQAPFTANKINSSVGSYGTYEMSLATVVTTTPVPGVQVGTSVTIEGATPTAWDNTWTVVQTPVNGLLAVSSTSMTSGTASFTYTVTSGSGPVVGDLVTVRDTTNGGGIFNVTEAPIATVSGGMFTITGFTSPDIPAAPETGQAQTVGNIFLIDPGPQFVGTSNTSSPIFGNDSGTGDIAYTNTSLNIGPGTRQCVVMFQTRNGYLTKPSPPVTFTVNNATSSLTVSSIPLGPPNVIARWLAFTEGGANGVPGAYFYAIPTPVNTIVNGQPYTFQSTVINDNLSTSAQFSFTDAVLLSSLEIDVAGGNQFNMIELGSSKWNINYGNRMFYGLSDNKITNFVNMSFSGGYIPVTGGNNFPLGWTADHTYGSGGKLILSSVFGDAYYIQNTTGSTQSYLGMITQPAFQDAYNTPIIQSNTLYSVRVGARIPSGLTGGNLVIDLLTFDNNIGYGHVYGTYTLPFSSLTENTSVQIGTLLTTAFPTVPTTLVLRVYVTNIVDTADIEIDRIEIFPTNQPTLSTSLVTSYVNNPEAFDGVTGILNVAGTNTQAINGGFIMYDQLYLLKQSSMFSTQDTPGSEPSGWSVHEVSNTVGTCGPFSYDVGEEWCVTACRQGLYVFFGKQPVKISQEIYQLWDAINWSAAGTIWVRNDIVNRRILIGVPMATGPDAASYQWLPNAPTVSNPTSPNVVLMLNYLGLGDITALADGTQMHTTMFGTLMSVDMRRKWSIWQISSPYADFILRQDGFSMPLFLCDANTSFNIDQLLKSQLSDNGTAINSLYMTYGWVDLNKQQQNPMLGFHRKIWTYLQMLASGSGNLSVSMLPNNVIPSLPFRGQALPPITLLANPPDDYERPLNVAGNRIYVQLSTNAVGAAFNLERLILVGGVAPLTVRGSASQ